MSDNRNIELVNTQKEEVEVFEEDMTVEELKAKAEMYRKAAEMYRKAGKESEGTKEPRNFELAGAALDKAGEVSKKTGIPVIYK